MAPVCGATGVWGSAVGCKKRGWGCGGSSERNQPNSAAGEKAPLVSVMSGQSLGVSGPWNWACRSEWKAGSPRPSEPAPPSSENHGTFTTRSLLMFATQPHYLNNMTIWMRLHPHTSWSDSQDVIFFFFLILPCVLPCTLPWNPQSKNILNIYGIHSEV